MDNISLIDWELTDDNKMIGRHSIFYILIKKLRNPINCNKPYELRIFKSGEIVLLHSYKMLSSAINCANEIVFKYYKLKESSEIKDNNIVYIRNWRKSHGSKK